MARLLVLVQELRESMCYEAFKGQWRMPSSGCTPRDWMRSVDITPMHMHNLKLWRLGGMDLAPDKCPSTWRPEYNFRRWNRWKSMKSYLTHHKLSKACLKVSDEVCVRFLETRFVLHFRHRPASGGVALRLWLGAFDHRKILYIILAYPFFSGKPPHWQSIDLITKIDTIESATN